MKIIDLVGLVVFTLDRNEVTPSSMLYLALQEKTGCDLNAYNEALGIARSSDLLTSRNHGLMLTDKGEGLRVKIAELFAKQAAAKVQTPFAQTCKALTTE